MLTSICYMGFKNNNGLLLYSKNSLIKFEIGDDHIPRQKSHPSRGVSTVIPLLKRSDSITQNGKLHKNVYFSLM